jgi:hypothetical protein
VTEKDQFGPVGNPLPEEFNYFILRNGWKWKGLAYITSTMIRANEFPGVIAGSILLIAGQNFIPGLQDHRASNQIDPIGGIGYEHQVGWGCAQKFCQWLDDLPDEVMILPAQEQYRLFLQLSLPALILLEDRFGAGTEGTMIEEDDGRVEQELGR